MQTAVFTPMTFTRQPALSMEAKKESYRDGYSHALLGMAWHGAYARSEQHYADGFAAGQEWLVRNGFTN
jgi:hypothetical protein